MCDNSRSNNSRSPLVTISTYVLLTNCFGVAGPSILEAADEVQVSSCTWGDKCLEQALHLCAFLGWGSLPYFSPGLLTHSSRTFILRRTGMLRTLARLMLS